MPEYDEFDREVRLPGRRWLRENPSPTSREFAKHRYWSRAKSELHRAYQRCAYTSRRVIGEGGSVDHFRPKSKYPSLAYEWDNFRLARPALNQNKADSEAVVDPFRVRDGWFVLDCPSCHIFSGDGLDASTMREVDSTISVLQLNSDKLAWERFRWLADLAMNKIPFSYVRTEYPFLAFEVERQGIRDELMTLFTLN